MPGAFNVCGSDFNKYVSIDAFCEAANTEDVTIFSEDPDECDVQ